MAGGSDPLPRRRERGFRIGGVRCHRPSPPSCRPCPPIGSDGRRAAPPPETPLILVGRDGRRRVILAADAAAQAAGLRVSMPARKAQARGRVGGGGRPPDGGRRGAGAPRVLDAAALRPDRNRLEAVINFAPKGVSEIADETCALAKAGVLNAVSIGFRPLKSEPLRTGGQKFTKWELLELSIVSVPANPSALVVQRAHPGLCA